MNILIRTDASVEIGSGHVMRCLTIADQLRTYGHQVTFWMLPLEGNLIEYVNNLGFPVTSQLQFADILIVDHYQLDESWESSMRAYTAKIVVIDDLANRIHDCDVLLDQNAVENYEHRYDQLVSKNCKKLLGPQFLIIRDEFKVARRKHTIRSGEVKRILVFMGGSDPTHETSKVLKALSQTTTSFEHIDVVVGSGNTHKYLIEQLCIAHGFSFHCQISNIANLMSKADFSIGAGGSTTWERCYVGLPSTSTIVADNQKLITEKAEQLGAIINLGWHEHVTVETYVQLLDRLPKLSLSLRQLSKQGLALTNSNARSNIWLYELLG